MAIAILTYVCIAYLIPEWAHTNIGLYHCHPPTLLPPICEVSWPFSRQDQLSLCLLPGPSWRHTHDSATSVRKIWFCSPLQPRHLDLQHSRVTQGHLRGGQEFQQRQSVRAHEPCTRDAQPRIYGAQGRACSSASHSRARIFRTCSQGATGVHQDAPQQVLRLGSRRHSLQRVDNAHQRRHKSFVAGHRYHNGSGLWRIP